MTGSLFGELVLGKSLGFTPSASPHYVSSTIFGYVSGNTIQFIDTRLDKKEESTNYLTKPQNPSNSTPQDTTHQLVLAHQESGKSLPSIIAPSQITAFATFHWEGVIAYAYKGSNSIKLVKWPSLSPIGLSDGTLTASNDLDIVSLAFSADGQYLASLGSLPNHTISIWDWKGTVPRGHSNNENGVDIKSPTHPAFYQRQISPLLCSTLNGSPAMSISFNPKDKRVLMTFNPGYGSLGQCERVGQESELESSDELDLTATMGPNVGLCKGIRFFKIEMGYRKWDIRSMPIKEPGQENQIESSLLQPKLLPTNLVEEPIQRRVVRQAIWTLDQTVVCTTNDIDALIGYNPYQGTSFILPPIEIESKPKDQTKEDVPHAPVGLPSKKGGRRSVLGKAPHKQADEKHRASSPSADHADEPVAQADMPTSTSQSEEIQRHSNFKSLAITRDATVIAGGSDGMIRFFAYSGPQSKWVLKRSYAIETLQKETQKNIISLTLSPDQSELLAETQDKRLFFTQTLWDQAHMIVSNDALKMTCLDAFLMNNQFVTASFNGDVILWENVSEENISLDNSDHHHAKTNALGTVKKAFSSNALGYQVLMKDRFTVPNTHFTSVATSPISSSLIALGSQQGYLRLYNLKISDDLVLTEEELVDLKLPSVKEEKTELPPSDGATTEATPTETPAANQEQVDPAVDHVKRAKKCLTQDRQPTLVFKQRLHSSPIEKILFDPTGEFVVTLANDGKAFLIHIQEDIKILGYFHFNGTLKSASWKAFTEEEEEEQEDNQAEKEEQGNNHFYILVEAENQSLIHRFTVPLKLETLEHEPSRKLQITRSSASAVTYKLDYIATDLAVLPSNLYAGKETFYILSQDRKLALHNGPSTNLNGGDDVLLIGKPLTEVIEHEKDGCQLVSGKSIEWLLTYSRDGYFTVRNIMEAENSLRIAGHDYYQGGVKSAVLMLCGQVIVTLGRDGLLKSWKWKFSPVGKRTAFEAVEVFGRGMTTKEKQTKELAIAINLLSGLSDEADQDQGAFYIQEEKTNDDAEDQVNVEQQQYTASMNRRIETIRSKLDNLIQKNETLPSLEKIDREEFVIDFEERDRLNAESEAKVKAVRKEIEESNLVKTIIKNRIKKECWDSMQVCGQSIKSFHPDPMTGKITEVTNYPLRKRQAQEMEFAAKIKLLRKTQIEVAKATLPRQKKALKEVDINNEENEDMPVAPIKKPESAQVDANSVSALLYDPFELTTGERRRLQASLLKEYILELKMDFNNKFQTMVKSKREEISKIEEKNERIKGILEELQIQENMIHPELDDSEMPEKTVEVLDSEVLVEKFITPEERKRLEEKRLQEEERLRSKRQDNWAERALNMMMGGKLEDRTEHEEKEVLVRPDWMNKPKEEMNDEERKLVKEFEKKLAVFKEEQEKYKKALETELRKLQSSITEMCDAFDKSLQEFFNVKLKTDQSIFYTKLKMLKLSQSCLFSEQDESRERTILSRLEQLKVEKSNYMNEIPEIKKDMEKAKEEYELLMKKDKELDRQFKKEFHGYDFYYDALMKLFRRRDSGLEDTRNISEPTQQAVGVSEKPATLWEDPKPLVPEVDMPEGLSPELWTKLIELRDKKIGSEKECRLALNRFQEMQILVQAVLDESERIRSETEKLTMDLNQFLEYKFHNTYNIESLFELKQGQVEVPQSAVLTDYSDAVLIHRSVVERLNESIGGLGKAKVDALKEMKEYRKGIHALEWENKMLDFQAEDQINRTRDIQLLRLTKQMQEYLRSGDEHAQATEIFALEKRADYSQKAHGHKMKEKSKALHKIRKKIREKQSENSRLDSQLSSLETVVQDRRQVAAGSNKHKEGTLLQDQKALTEIYTRRRLVDLAKSQAQDIAILREEVERLRLRTYPAFSPSSKAAF